MPDEMTVISEDATTARIKKLKMRLEGQLTYLKSLNRNVRQGPPTCERHLRSDEKRRKMENRVACTRRALLAVGVQVRTEREEWIERLASAGMPSVILQAMADDQLRALVAVTPPSGSHV